MTQEYKEEYFIPSPFCIPMPDGSMEDLLLPGTMIEEHVSKRLRRNRPFYCIPPPSPEVWKKKDGVHNGYRILVHRCFVSLENSIIVHDYIHVKCNDAIEGWVQKYAAYYSTEKVAYLYDEYACEYLETRARSNSPRTTPPTSTILCSLSFRPRTIKLIRPISVKKCPLS